MDQHSNFARQANTKSFIANTTTNNLNANSYSPSLRIPQTIPYKNSIMLSRQQLRASKPIGFHPSNSSNGKSGSLTGSGKYGLTSSGSITPAQTNLASSIGTSSTTPKSIPSFLEGRNNLKNSLFMSDGEGKDFKYNSQTLNHAESVYQKRVPRMSEQPDMKLSSTQFGNEQKIPSFLQEKSKKVLHNNDIDRPESSKDRIFQNQIPSNSLSNSYGSMKRKNTADQNDLHIDPTTQWVKKSWGKKKQKKLTINDFQQIKDLGSGKYGHVYLARQKRSNYICALKIIEKKLLLQQQITQQFIRQLKIQVFLNHPNIIHMYGFFDDHINIYIILELGTGGQLLKQLKKHQSMPEQKVAGIMRQVCQAVSQLHSNRIIHRDIKPENIVISQGVVKLLDFGWSVYSGQTLRNTFCGTPFYVGPQILKGNQYNQKIDIWSLGVMVYEMLIGENPFKITKEEELIKIVKDQIKIPTYVEVSIEARNFIFSCLQKNPDDRSNIRELLNHEFFKKYPEKSDKKVSF